VAGLVAVGVVASKGRRGARPAAVAYDAKTPLPALTQGLRDSDARALAELFQRSAAPADARPQPLADAEAAEWVEALKAVRTGFLKFGAYGRVSVLAVAGRVLERLGVEPAPAPWAEALGPAHDLLASGLADNDPDVRSTALGEVGRLWSWVPGRTLLSAEENALAAWKAAFIDKVVKRLGDREPKARAAAVACLGYLPINDAAAPAIAYLDDPKSPDVRRQVIASFATRPALLTDDALLKHMYDPGPGVAESAELVLKARGLNREQISLGSMIFHPKPEIRASVIPLLKERTDVDPVVWLLQLSHDPEESVRIGAVEALGHRLSPEAGRRLAEMAATDKSPAVRRAASKLLPESEKTAALPPLPGSPSLNPKAN
jgi:HEAT repeat protein